MNASDAEPVSVDPAKLRRTAWILVVIMVVGGFLILKAYEKMSVNQAKDNRPAIIHQIRKERDLTVIRQDGKTSSIFDLRGKVVAMHSISLDQPKRAQRSFEVMKRLSEEFADTPDVQLVTLVIDPPPPEQALSVLSSAASDFGMALPDWWLATTEKKTLHKFIRNELKTSVPPHKTEEGWQFDTSIYLIDRKGHLRRAVILVKDSRSRVVPFDFDQAAEWDAQDLDSGTDLTNEQQLEKLLRETIRLLLAEPATTP